MRRPEEDRAAVGVTHTDGPRAVVSNDGRGGVRITVEIVGEGWLPGSAAMVGNPMEAWDRAEALRGLERDVHALAAQAMRDFRLAMPRADGRPRETMLAVGEPAAPAPVRSGTMPNYWRG